MQAPGICAAADGFETVTPAALEASATVTSMHASTFEMVLALGVGVGVTEDFEDELGDPQAPTRRPHIATTAIRPLADRNRAAPEMPTSGSLARGRRAVKRPRTIGRRLLRRRPLR